MDDQISEVIRASLDAVYTGQSQTQRESQYHEALDSVSKLTESGPKSDLCLDSGKLPETPASDINKPQSK